MDFLKKSVIAKNEIKVNVILVKKCEVKANNFNMMIPFHSN